MGRRRPCKVSLMRPNAKKVQNVDLQSQLGGIVSVRLQIADREHKHHLNSH